MGSDQSFKVNINCVVLGVDVPTNQQWVLSMQQDDILFPSFSLTHENINNLTASIYDFIKPKMPNHSDIELIPQLISLHSNYITNQDNNLNVVYGFVVDQKEINENYYWIPFDYMKPNQYSNVIFEVIQKLY